MRVAYCTGFWSTNIGNGFFSMGVEYALKKILGKDNVTVVSDLQTYANGLAKRNWPHKNQLDYLSYLEVDYIVLAGPVISKYFLSLWKEILLKLEAKGIGYILLSAGIMKMDEKSKKDCIKFFSEHPPYILSSREQKTYDLFSKYATHAYNGICFSFFAPDFYKPAGIDFGKDYITYNFDKMIEPTIIKNKTHDIDEKKYIGFTYNGFDYLVKKTKFNSMSSKTDRLSDALVYIRSMFPQKKQSNVLDDFKIVRTDHRFYPHFRNKMFSQSESFAADLPYGYLNLYANTSLTLSDRIHACAVTLAYGNYAMLFAHTGRVGLLDRVGAGGIMESPVKLDIDSLNHEKQLMIDWLKLILS